MFRGANIAHVPRSVKRLVEGDCTIKHPTQRRMGHVPFIERLVEGFRATVGPAPRARSRTRRSCWPAWRAGRRGRRRCDSKKLLMCLGCARRLFPRRHGLGRDWPSTKFWREPPGGCARARANASSLLIGFAAPKKHMQIIDPIDASERAPHPTLAANSRVALLLAPYTPGSPDPCSTLLPRPTQHCRRPSLYPSRAWQ